MRDLKQLKRSAKHFNLASGAFMPRARARALIYISPSLRPILSFRCVFLVLSARRQVADAEGWKRAYYLRSSREQRRRVVWTSSEPKRGGGRTRWTDIDRTGAGKVRGRQKRAKRTKRRQQDGGGGGGGGGGGDGLTPVCLRGANGVLQLF